MRAVFSPTAAPVKIVTGQTPGAERQRCRAPRRRDRDSAGGGGPKHDLPDLQTVAEPSFECSLVYQRHWPNREDR